MATFDQRDQDVTTQYNAGRDIHIYAQATPRGGLDSHEQAFLQAVASAMDLTHSPVLEADQVNELAALLDRPLTEVPQLVARLQGASLVELQWGGRVVLTPEGRACADERGPEPRVGKGPLGPGAVPGERIHSLGGLTAVVQALRRGQEDLPPAAKATAQQLGDEVAALVHTLQQPQPDQRRLQLRLDQVTMLLGQLTRVAEETSTLGPTLTRLGTAVDVIRRWVLGG